MVVFVVGWWGGGIWCGADYNGVAVVVCGVVVMVVVVLVWCCSLGGDNGDGVRGVVVMWSGIAML